jgi:hypothetical protein
VEVVEETLTVRLEPLVVQVAVAVATKVVLVLVERELLVKVITAGKVLTFHHQVLVVAQVQ